MSARAWVAAAIAGLTLASSAAALAHKASDSYLTLELAEGRVGGRWEIAIRDVDLALDLDADADGEITWGELKGRERDLAAWALSRLAVRNGGEPCELGARALAVDRHSDGAYAVLALDGACAGTGPLLRLDYRLLFDLDPQHRGLVRVVSAGGESNAVLTASAASISLSVGGGAGSAIAAYFREGVAHIGSGVDHVLFLLSLLLPAVLVRARRGGRETWAPADGLRPAFVDVAKIVTAFTLAHSITLTLAALSWVEPPSRWVESAIALSVVVAALNNLRPLIRHGRWIAAFAFGLVHGFGFAGALADLGLPRDSLALSLAAFNVGVEAGQLAIVAAFLPLAYALRATVAYRVLALRAGSAAIAAVAAIWFAERAFDLTVF
ncbi:MAG: HupE/UreJ family protein [Burkholderiales bacterium]